MCLEWWPGVVGGECCRLIRHVKMIWQKPGCQGGKGHFKEGSMEVQSNRDVRERSISLSIKWGPGELVKELVTEMKKWRGPDCRKPDCLLCCTKELGLYSQAKVKAYADCRQFWNSHLFTCVGDRLEGRGSRQIDYHKGTSS